MHMTHLILPTILCCGIAYLLCGIPFGLLVTKARGIDIRKVGSGNIGTTNVARAAGVGASALTLLLDAGKGFVSMMIGRLLIPALGPELRVVRHQLVDGRPYPCHYFLDRHPFLILGLMPWAFRISRACFSVLAVSCHCCAI